MRLLFVGLGSIGNRHLKNTLQILNEKGIIFTIDALRVINAPLASDISTTLSNIYTDVSEISSEYDVTFITNPTHLHHETLKAVTPFSKAVFIEKPVFTKSDSIKDLNLRRGAIYHVACPLRFSSVYIEMKKIVEKSTVLSARAICSSYLPDWRKSTNYRNSYSAKEAGGGVRYDLIHEMDYLYDLFSSPTDISIVAKKISDLEIESNDIVCYILEYMNKVVSLHLDYFGRFPKRELELFTLEDTIVGDFLNNRISYLKAGVVNNLDPLDIHMEEMRYFFDLLEGKEREINGIIKAADIIQYI